ncbi:uncharacterized protein At1g32220, chloroplastic isoform X1 [Amaranthus tricolor]|uniref:uncharacterized protein At1g32220, chloroplastic isoform X1 n=1 Tax=Amaranthus tricolor TaxID=29722 RepID=UPI002584F854|nr:uncharacterized protein At1g32220, chloroplastic isoform X1 [Amaranthus tricolor]
MSRLNQARYFLSLSQSLAMYRSCRFLSTESAGVNGGIKVEEAETVNVPPPSSEKLLVFGGNGFVGSHVCKEALERGLSVSSISRSGRSSINEPWADRVSWHQGNLFSPETIKDVLDGVTSVISCVGGFGSNSYMYKINGTTNMNAIRAAAEKGVKRFVYISAADFGVVNYLLQGYYEGKRAAETELLTKFPYGGYPMVEYPLKRGLFQDRQRYPFLVPVLVPRFKPNVVPGVILRPGFIYGTRQVGSMKLPLGVIGTPLETVLQYTKPLTKIPLIGPLLTPPVDVDDVAKVAVRAATDPVFPPGIVDVNGILRYSRQRKK